MIVSYFAAARAAAGVEQERLELGAPLAFGELLALLAARHPESASPTAPALPELLGRCSFLRNEVVLRDHTAPVTDQDRIDVLPPFAGG